MKIKFITILLLSLILIESCAPRPACGNRRAHKTRTAKMKRSGMWM